MVLVLNINFSNITLNLNQMYNKLYQILGAKNRQGKYKWLLSVNMERENKNTMLYIFTQKLQEKNLQIYY